MVSKFLDHTLIVSLVHRRVTAFYYHWEDKKDNGKKGGVYSFLCAWIFIWLCSMRAYNMADKL